MENKKSFWAYFFSNIGLAVITIIITGIYIFGATLTIQALMQPDCPLGWLVFTLTLITTAVSLTWFKAYQMWKGYNQ